MDTTFPFGFAWPTVFYLTLYLLTFVLHQAFMHYVLAGSLYVTWATIRPGHDPVPMTHQPLAATLRDWMPFLLSAAITAGVAPLLFVQVVYQRPFYTANLLLWWRWMALVPVLIVAFYLLYLVKSRMLWNWPYFVRVTVVSAASICFVFAGFCWTVNHLLANSSTAWAEVYVTGRLPFSTFAVVLRMLIWLGGAFASMSVITGWQLQYQKITDKLQTTVHSLAGMSIVGLGIALLAGITYVLQCDSRSRSVVFGLTNSPYLLATLAGAIAQIIGWTRQWRSQRLERFWLAIATGGALLCLIGVSVIREELRSGAIDLTSLSQQHSAAASVGGFSVFVVAAMIVSLLIAWCVRLVQAGTKS